ncbi:hypothetical protein ACQYWY_09520 [Comamonas sediminis]
MRDTIAKSGPGLITASKVMVITANSSVIAYPVQNQKSRPHGACNGAQ